MTQENKELLLVDICTRLPYKVKISIPELFTNKEQVETLNEIFKGKDDLYRVNDSGILIEYIKPYLFPLSSITKEQLFEVQEILGKSEIEIKDSFLHIVDSNRNTISYSEITALLEWFYKNHFDINNLIPMKLAIDATGLNIY